MTRLPHLPPLIRFLIMLFFTGGVFFTFLIPPFQKPDEVVHFKKTVAVATGQPFCSRGPNQLKTVFLPTYLSQLSTDLYTDIVAFYPEAKIPKQTYKDLLTKKYNTNLMSTDSTTCTLPFIYYLPAAIAITPLLALNAHPIMTFYAGRLAIFLTTFILFILSLRFMPRKYYFLLLFMFGLPTTLLLITSYSKDALHIGFGLLAFSILFAAREQPKLVKKEDVILFYVSILLAVWARIQYVPFLMLGLLLPLPRGLTIVRLSNTLKKIVIFLIVAAIFFGGLFFMIKKGVYTGDQADSTKILVQSYIYPSVQLQIAKTNPLIPVQVIVRSINENIGGYVNSMIAITGWFETYNIAFVYIAYYGFFIYLIAMSTRAFIKLNTKETVLLCFVSLATIFGIFMAMWLYGTPVGSRVVENVNGRYFILLIPLVVWAMSSIYKLLGKKLPYIIVSVTAFLICLSIYNRYYNTTRYYDKNVDHVYVEESNFIEHAVSNDETLHIDVDPSRKLIGIRIFIANVLPVKPYKISALDKTCALEMASAIPNMAAIKSNSYNDILFEKTTTSNVLCLRFKILAESSLTENMKVMKIKSKDQIEIYPLYLY